MIVVSEQVCQECVGEADAFSAVESVFSAMAKGDARNFPVIREAIGHADALYGFKSGFDRTNMALGVKSGGYWPGNSNKGLTNHQSTIFLFEPDTGQLRALVGGNYLTAIRTAAASAVSISHLARKDVKVLGLVGAGHQAAYQIRAAVRCRKFEKIIAWNRDPVKLSGLEAVAKELELPFEAVQAKQIGSQADVIITITSAHDPLLMKGWVNPGTHIAAMGADTAGKQELDPELAAMANLFTDEISQSISIGENQHAVNAGLVDQSNITPIGDVINGIHPGRASDEDITLFDGTGVGLQDLAVATAAANLASANGSAIEIESW